MTTQPTQVQRPWRSTIRTIFQAFIGLCFLAPLLVAATDVDVDQLPWLVIVLAVAAAITRIMALPGVEDWLGRFFPWLSADEDAGPRDGGYADVRAIAAVSFMLTLIFLALVLIFGLPLLQ